MDSEKVGNPIFSKISHWRDLNPRPADYESAAIPLSHSGTYFVARMKKRIKILARMMRTNHRCQNLQSEVKMNLQVKSDFLLSLLGS